MQILTFLIALLLAADELPELNRKILIYLDGVIGHQVHRGECWDLAAGALDFAGAYLDRSTQASIYIFGREIDPVQETVFPGDIIQFKDVTLEYETDEMIVMESMSHHTAVIYEVIGPGDYKIAHQNTRLSGKKVGLSNISLENIKKGTLIFYRPVGQARE
jgi:hypothetical protein